MHYMISASEVSYVDTISFFGPEALIITCQGVTWPLFVQPRTWWELGYAGVAESKLYLKYLTACQYVTYFELQAKDVLMCVCL